MKNIMWYITRYVLYKRKKTRTQVFDHICTVGVVVGVVCAFFVVRHVSDVIRSSRSVGWVLSDGWYGTVWYGFSMDG